MIFLDHLDPFGGSNIALSDAKLYWSSLGPRWSKRIAISRVNVETCLTRWFRVRSYLGSPPARDLMHGGNPSSLHVRERKSRSPSGTSLRINPLNDLMVENRMSEEVPERRPVQHSKFKVKRHCASAFPSGWLIDKRLTIIEQVFRMRIQNTSEYMVLN